MVIVMTVDAIINSIFNIFADHPAETTISKGVIHNLDGCQDLQQGELEALHDCLTSRWFTFQSQGIGIYEITVAGRNELERRHPTIGK